MGTPANSSARQQMALEWVKQHPSLAFGALTSIYVSIRLVRAAHGSRETTLYILRALEPADVLILSLTEFAPPMLLLGLCTALLYRATLGEHSIPRELAVAVGLAGFLLSPIWLAASAGLLIPATYITGRWARRQIQTGGSGLRRWLHLGDRYDAAMGVPLALMFAAVLLFDDRTWLPTERVELDNGSAAVGYVLDEGNEELVFMRNSDRVVFRISSDDVERAACVEPSSTSWHRRSLLSLLHSSPAYQSCR